MQLPEVVAAPCGAECMWCTRMAKGGEEWLKHEGWITCNPTCFARLTQAQQPTFNDALTAAHKALSLAHKPKA